MPFENGGQEALGTVKVTFNLEKIFSRSGSPYLGCVVGQKILQPYLDQMKLHLGGQYEAFEANRFDRDGGEYHVTVVGPREYSSLAEDVKVKVRDALGKQLKFKLVGLGCSKNSTDSTFYVVMESMEAADLRNKLGLSERDFHATLGFERIDIHGVRKDASTLVN